MEELNQNEKLIWSCWEQKNPSDVVREAAAKGTHLNLAVKYLMSKNSWDETTARDWFIKEVKAWTIELLTRKQIFKVLHILNKVDINTEEHLMTIAEVSPNIEFRDFIVQQLEKISPEIKSENVSCWENFRRHWHLLQCLEKSFESSGTFKQNKVFGFNESRIIVNESEIKCMTIENIGKYPHPWKSKIATVLFFDTFELSLIEFSSPELMWNHLLEENKAMVLMRWINIQTSEVVRDKNARYNFFNNESFEARLLNVDLKGFNKEALEKLDDIFRKWPITNEMITSVATSNCFEYSKMCIYDTLCSYGIVNDLEQNSLLEIIRRLSRTENLKLLNDIFSEPCATIPKASFYIELARYCVKNKLYKVLTTCVEGSLLDTDVSCVDQESKDCIQLWLLFKSVKQSPDRQNHVVSIYKTCQQIAGDKIDDYISVNPQLLLGMILLEEDAKLFDIFTNKERLEFKNFKLPNIRCKDKYPHMYRVYEKFSDDTQVFQQKDVNVYQLLTGYRGLDVSKVFEFQLINQSPRNVFNLKADRRSLGSLLSNDIEVNSLAQIPTEMPDFTNEKLMKRYGYVAKLNHMYYLKQYRPCNASQAFVMQQYLTYNRLQDRSIKSACCEVHALTLRNWNDLALASCAVSFIAMIGCNPTRCRVHMSVANMLNNYVIKYEGKTTTQAYEIVNEHMSNLIQNKDDAAKNLLHYIEKITMNTLKELKKIKANLDITTILYESQTMVKFAVLHKLPMPESQLMEFVKTNSWFQFLVYGDVFRYPLSQMIQLSQKFENKPYLEHLKNIMMHRNVDDIADKDCKSNASSYYRRPSRLLSTDSPVQGHVFEFPLTASIGRELWEVAAACHGPEDPPAALIRSAELCGEPLLVLIASCYEPNAVDMLWVHWMLTSLDQNARAKIGLQSDMSLQPVSIEKFQYVAEICLQEGYVTTLHESILIFMPESPLLLLTSFLCRCIRQHTFDSETHALLNNFLNHCRRKYSVDTRSQRFHLTKEALQSVSVGLVKVGITHNFDSAYNQCEFLKCLTAAQFGKGFSVKTPNFEILYEILKISMETPITVNVSKMLLDDANQYLAKCIDDYIANRNYDTAFKIAKLAGLTVNSILTAEWKNKYQNLYMKEEVMDSEVVLFIARCSQAFKSAGVEFRDSIDFLVNHVEDVSDPVQKFYSYRIVMTWFEDNSEYGSRREEIEHLMWGAYFQSECQGDIFLNSYQSTLHFILNGQKDATMSRKIANVNSEKPFCKLLSEIEIESDVGNIENVLVLEKPEAIDNWRNVIYKLLELKLLVEAFRLSVLMRISSEYPYRSPPCPVQIIRTCIKLAEGTCSPYDLPPNLRMAISSPSRQSKLSMSEVSDASFEELVVIQEMQENIPGTSQLAGREDADRLSALEALASRGLLTVAKQIASFYRISIQIGWTYTAVLKYENNPIDFISLVSGRARMSLANLVFKTFNITIKEIADYLAREMVAAIISPHLVKTSTFRQKEHFQYTLWGYALNSDIEMFLNMRPDSCTQIGRLILDNLMAFRKIYKTSSPKHFETNPNDNLLDIDTLIDEEYQNIDEEDINSVVTDGGTQVSAETESVYSVSTVYSVGNKMSRDSRRNIFDVITKNNVHIKYEVKSNIRKITQGAKLTTKQVNIISIELLVLAHECFSCACDTEGVAVILRSAQALTMQLLAARSWRLMVRLLTGLGRYKEMAYVFQMLRDNHQFEYLLGQFDYMLGQQIDKINEFKQGLLDFLKTHCPGDTETYIMVALHFNMYSEAANVKKKQALALIEDLEKIALDSSKMTSKKPAPQYWLQIFDNQPTKLLLQTALDHCTDATELYLQAGCTGLAGEMAVLAQQIALQISLLNASPTRLIVNRSTEQMYKLVSEYLSFMEGLILLTNRSGEAWRELAYRRSLTNDQAYLRDMALYRPDIAHDFLNRYQTEKNKTTVSQAAMSDLRNLCR